MTRRKRRERCVRRDRGKRVREEARNWTEKDEGEGKKPEDGEDGGPK